MEKFLQLRRTGLFISFYHKDNIASQLPFFDQTQYRQNINKDLALIIGYSPTIDFFIIYGHLKGVTFSSLRNISCLHIIMPIDKTDRQVWIYATFCKDDRITKSTDDLSIHAVLIEKFSDSICAFLHIIRKTRIRRYTFDSYEFAQ